MYASPGILAFEGMTGRAALDAAITVLTAFEGTSSTLGSQRAFCCFIGNFFRCSAACWAAPAGHSSW